MARGDARCAPAASASGDGARRAGAGAVGPDHRRPAPSSRECAFTAGGRCKSVSVAGIGGPADRRRPLLLATRSRRRRAETSAAATGGRRRQIGDRPSPRRRSRAAGEAGAAREDPEPSASARCPTARCAARAACSALRRSAPRAQNGTAVPGAHCAPARAHGADSSRPRRRRQERECGVVAARDRSYEGMGMARGECVAGCKCASRRGRPARRRSTAGPVSKRASPRDADKEAAPAADRPVRAG